MAYLVAGDSPHAGKCYELTRAVTMIGRHPSNDICIESGTVGARHCRITRDGDEFFVEDVASRRPAQINGKPIHGRNLKPLQDGDKLWIAGITLTFMTSLPQVSEISAAIGTSQSRPPLPTLNN